MTPAPPPALVIAGPTASGKSALALIAAEAFGGTVINADSMQVYAPLRILTARPCAADEARVPHRLYGIAEPDAPCSAAWWRDRAKAEMEAAWAENRVPIITGGTGFYIDALTRGLSPIPEIPADIRDEARALLARLGNDDFHARLAARDPVMAGRLAPGNSQRVVRAWEVLEATGRSLADWQTLPREGAVSARFLSLVLLPQREALFAACDGRFHAMIAAGALDEARAVLARGLDRGLPMMKALGLPPLLDHLEGRLTLDAAIDRACRDTSAYAKRQVTWFRHQMGDAVFINEQFSESVSHKTLPKIRDFLLTAQ